MSFSPSPEFIQQCHSIPVDAQPKLFPCHPSPFPPQLQPIHEIFGRSDLGHMGSKRQHLKRALEEFLLEFSPCRCGKCHNNGEPVLVGDSCSCQCRPGYRGPACEQGERPGESPGCSRAGGEAAKGMDLPFQPTKPTPPGTHTSTPPSLLCFVAV